MAWIVSHSRPSATLVTNLYKNVFFCEMYHSLILKLPNTIPQLAMLSPTAAWIKPKEFIVAFGWICTAGARLYFSGRGHGWVNSKGSGCGLQKYKTNKKYQT